MTIKGYIKETIDTHEEKFRLRFSRSVRGDIERYINNGVYAFQFIYKWDHLVSELKPLDYKLCIHERNINPNGTMWSYDAGKRYQWTERETLVFDTSVIRNIKLEKVLNDSN